MLNKSRRLRLTRDFERIFSKGRSINSSLFKLRILKNTFNFSRFAVVVSTKVSKRAVIRNRLRRRVWSVIAKNSYTIPKGLDIVFIALVGASQADFSGTQSEINYLLKKLS
jgi:ribonuclease P protein component